jgi:hypothetical protein
MVLSGNYWGGWLAPLGPLWLDVIEPASIGIGQRDILAVLIQYNVLEHTDRQGMRSGCSRIMMQIPHVQSRPVRTLQDQVELWIEIDPPIIDKQLDDGVVLAEVVGVQHGIPRRAAVGPEQSSPRCHQE